MLKHLFKLIWNKKKQNALLITEILVSFIVIFAVFTLLVYGYKNYKQRIGFEYENVWLVNFTPPENINSADSIDIFHKTLINTLQSMPQIEVASFAGNNTPFSFNSSNTEVAYNNAIESTNLYQTGEGYKQVLNLTVKEGRWFSKEDNAAKEKTVVINEKLKEKLFQHEAAVGKMIDAFRGQRDMRKVIGVIQDMKDQGEYQVVENGMYMKMDTGWMRWAGSILLKLKPNTDAAFESKLYKTLSRMIGTSIEIEHLNKKLVNKNKFTLVPIIILSIVSGFLIINVALGLFGVLWYNISKRKGEIGLRRAVGASGNSISIQLVGEALVLSTISILIGSFFAIQFPLMNVFDLVASTYFIALALSVIFIYLLVMLCAFYPGKQAAAIYPAVALHEE